MLTVKNLSAGYEHKTVLQNVSFSLDWGLTVLLGQNGSGKTTLFRCLTGALRPLSGTAELDGTDLLALGAKKRAACIAEVLGTHATLAGITGEDLAAMAFYHKNGLFSSLGAAQREQIRTVARSFGAEPLLTRRLETLSAGERQTLELVAAVCQDTPVLLLDEPTSALDFNRCHAFLARAQALGREKILLATLHDPALALGYADRILLLKDGTLAGDFRPADVTASEAEARLQSLYPQIHVLATGDQRFVLCRS